MNLYRHNEVIIKYIQHYVPPCLNDDIRGNFCAASKTLSSWFCFFGVTSNNCSFTHSEVVSTWCSVNVESLLFYMYIYGHMKGLNVYTFGPLLKTN